MKFFGVLGCGTRNNPLNFGSHPYNADLHQSQQYNISQSNKITTDRIFMKILPESESWNKEMLIPFWKSSREQRPHSSPSNGAPDHVITADHIFMKILPEMYLRTRKSPLDFGSYLQSADLCQSPTISLSATSHNN